jgi:CPA2 family monovalent cation:H+ antiporter-2
MPHHAPLIATLVGGLVLAFVLGALAHRLRVSPIVGYLLAGVLVGPSTPGFVADPELAGELAEIGVILLMFGVGLHFSLNDLLAVRAISVPGAILQMVFATLVGMGLASSFGWALGADLVFGLALSVASTVVLLRALQERRLIDTEQGRIAVGWLIVQDLAVVLVLVLLPPLSALLGGTGAVGSTVDAQQIATTVGTTSRTPVRGSCFGWPCSRWRSASPMERPNCLVFRSRWARSSPAWCLPSRNLATGRRKNRCRCAMPSQYYSLFPSGCCSIRPSW